MRYSKSLWKSPIELNTFQYRISKSMPIINRADAVVIAKTASSIDMYDII